MLGGITQIGLLFKRGSYKAWETAQQVKGPFEQHNHLGSIPDTLVKMV